MPKLVGIFNAPPVYSMGLAGALSDADYSLEETADPHAWLKDHPAGTLLVGVHQRADFDLIVELAAEDPQSVIVTLVDQVSMDSVEATLSAGAAGSVSLNAHAGEVVLALDAASNHSTVLPTYLAQSLAKTGSRRQAPDCLGEDEQIWLRALARGETVTELSRRLGFSEREMYRRLRRLYAEMGATGRTDALLRASRWGLLD